MAFERLFNRNRVSIDFDAVDQSTENPVEEAEEGTVSAPENNSEERYRLEISTTYDRARGDMYPYRSVGSIFDDSGVKKNGPVHTVHGVGDSIKDAEDSAIYQATKWIKQQKIIDAGPQKKTVFLPKF